MPWTQVQIDALKAAIVSGTKSVSYGDKTVVYQSTRDMLDALAVAEAEVAADDPTDTGGSRTTYVSFSRD